MPEAMQPNEPTEKSVDARLLIRTFYIFAALAVLSIIISVAGKWIGASLAMVGHSDDTTIHEVVLGNNVMQVPGNLMRFEKARQSGEALRLDIYMRWPELDGYSRAAQHDFNHRGGSRSIIFASIEPGIMSRDMSGRFEPIYRRVVQLPPRAGPAGLSEYAFKERSGYVGEVLYVGRSGDGYFVARCLIGAAAADSLAPCERDVHFGKGLSVTYRFPAHLLEDWPTLDSQIVGRVSGFLRTAR